jgi:uncharacterized protein (TIGR03085 family)
VTYSRDERLALAALLEETGPEAPTLCAGWQTKDLAAHVVVRERRPDAGVGMLGGPLAGYTDRVRQGYLDRYSYPQLIAFFRSGPPRLSPFAIPGADEAANTVEYFVHHEDVRRGAAGWTERDLPPGESDALWKRLKSARLFLRGAPTGVALVRGAGESPDDVIDAKQGRTDAGSAGRIQVGVVGTPAELTLWSMGRVSAANVTFDGPEEAVARLTAWRR